MKRYFFVTFSIFCFLAGSCFADEWDSLLNVDRAWDAQKSITNKEFEEALDYKEQAKKQNEEKIKKKKVKKISGGGTSLHNELEPSGEILENPILKKNEDGILLNVPVNLIIDDIPLEKGYYKIMAQKDKNNDIYLLFYQSQFFKGKVRASETDNDFEEETIDFAKLIPYNDSFVKIIYGSLDFNAYAYVRYTDLNVTKI